MLSEEIHGEVGTHMNQRTPNDREAPLKRVLGWQAAHLLMALLFVFLLYWQERSVLAEITQDHARYIQTQIHSQLTQKLWPLLPPHAWRLFLPVLLVGLSALLFGKWRWYLLSFAGMVGSLLLLADRVYFDFFGAILSLDSLRVAGQLWDVRESVDAAVRLRDFAPILIFCLFAVYGFLANRFGIPENRKQRPMFFATKALALVFLALALHLGLVAFSMQQKEVSVSALTGTGGPQDVAGFFGLENNSPKDYAAFFGIFNYHLDDARLAVTELFRDMEIAEQDLAAMTFLLEEKKRVNDLKSPFFGMAEGRNLLMISMESFQYFLLDLEIEGREVTPVMNRLRREALSFDFILDNINRGGTSDAEFMVMTGLLPDHRRRASLNYPAKRSLISLPNLLKDAGYHTLSFHGNDPAFWNRHVNHPVYGIERMYFRSFFQYPTDKLGIPDEVFLAQSAEVLAKAAQPFFAFIITLSSHHPYTLVTLEESFFPTPFETDSMEARYLRAAHYADAHLGKFLKDLGAAGLLQNSLLFIYGDHTAPLDRESRERVQTTLGIHTDRFRNLCVPFLILMPGKEEELRPHQEEYEAVIGGLQDFFPTALHLLGMEVPFGLTGLHLFVKNDQRGPLPFLHAPNGFIDRGILYVNGGRITDGEGLVFQPLYDLPKLSLDQVKQNILRTNAERELHHQIFDKDAQIRILEYRAARSN